MRPRRLKLEFYDGEGVRHVISVDGPVTREKVGKILDIVELMAGTNRPTPTTLGLSQRKFDRLTTMIMSQLRDRDFTSREVKKSYETSFREGIPLSTVSTYLTRLLDRGVLEREGGSVGLVYRVRLEGPRQPLAQNPSRHAL